MSVKTPAQWWQGGQVEGWPRHSWRSILRVAGVRCLLAGDMACIKTCALTASAASTTIAAVLQIRHTLLDPTQVLAGGRPFYVGYKPQLKAALALGYLAAEANKPYSLLLVGLPGTGKTLFPKVLVWELCRAGLEYWSLWIPCGRYAALYRPDEVIGHLHDVNSKLMEGPQRMVVVLDEMDAIAPERGDSASGVTMSHWTLETMRSLNEREGARLTVGVSNHPIRVDRAILNEIGPSMYFDLATDEQATKILVRSGVPHAADVLEKYKGLCVRSGCAYTGRSLQKAAGKVRSLFSCDLDSFTSDRWASALHAQGGLLASHTVGDYEERNGWVIDPARELVESLQAIFATLLNQGVLQEVYDPDEQAGSGMAAEAVQ